MDFCRKTNICTLLDLLTYRASLESQSANNTAFTFLDDGEIDAESLTFLELSQRAKELARHLQTYTNPSDRVLLVYPPGLDYIVAFFA